MNRRPLRVAMIIQSYLPCVGGAERQLEGLIPLLRDRGVETRIFTRCYPGMAPFAVINGTPVYRTPTLSSWLRPAQLGKAADALTYTLFAVARLRHWHPDLIHAHELLSPATTALVAQRLWRAPIVAKVLRGGKLGDINKLHSRAGGRLRLRALRRNVAAFIAISREIDDELAAVGVPAERRVHIPNGVDTGRFSRLSSADRRCLRTTLGLTGGPVIIYTGRLVPEKRLELLLEAWSPIRVTHPTAILLVAGSGPEGPRLKKHAGPGVRFLGQVEDVAPYLQAADVFVLPSATEGLSNALLEAMATGLPPIATAVGGAPDVILQGENGLLVPPNNKAALTEALYSLLDDPVRRATLGKAASIRITANYSLNSIAARLRTLYDTVLAESSPGLPDA